MGAAWCRRIGIGSRCLTEHRVFYALCHAHWSDAVCDLPAASRRGNHLHRCLTYGVDAGATNRFGNFLVGRLAGNACRVDSGRGSQCGKKIARLCIFTIFETCTASRIGFTGDEETLEAFRAAKCVRFLEYFDDGRRVQLERPVAMRMELGNKQAEIATGAWHRQAFGHCPDQFAAT